MVCIRPAGVGLAAQRCTAGRICVDQRLTYGPYLEDGVPTSPGNLAFDQSLRERNPTWDIRRIEDAALEAAKAGLKLMARHAMPANNLLLVWARQPPVE